LKRTTIALTLALACLAAGSFAAEGDSLWSVNNTGLSHGNVVIPSGDGNFLVAGRGNGAVLLKVSPAGQVLWQRNYGGFSFDALIPAGDGNFLLAGCHEAGVLMDLYLVKVNAAGDSLWRRTYDDGGNEEGYCLLPTGDGHFLVGGRGIRLGMDNTSMLVAKITPQGDLLWLHTFGGQYDDFVNAMAPAPDSGYLLAGGVGNTYWNPIMALVKVNAQGDSLWTRTYGDYTDPIEAMLPSGDGNYLLAGSIIVVPDMTTDAYLVKVDPQGEPLWTHTYACTEEGNEWAGDMIATSDGCYLLAGGATPYIFDTHVGYLVKVNPAGDLLWSSVFDGYTGYGFDHFHAVAQAPQGGDYIATGECGDFTTPHLWLLGAEGSSPAPVSVTLAPDNPPVTLPNTGGTFTYTATLQNDTVAYSYFDVWGMALQPNGSWLGPVVGPLALSLPGNAAVTRLRTQTVPATAPAGEYWFEARVGDYPGAVWDTSGFYVYKLGVPREPGTGDRGEPSSGLDGWTGAGEPFPGETQDNFILPPSSFILSTFPNPFNPETAVGYRLPVSGYVTLRVYDTAGREVRALVDGWRVAGAHEVTFDAAGLPSGIYFARLQAGDFTQTQKLVLLK